MAQYNCFTDINDTFMGPKGYSVDYRLVITRALFNCIKNKVEPEQLKFKLIEAILFLNNMDDDTNDHFYYPGFIEIYRFIKNTEQGILLIDRSKGCYPLVAYPTSGDSEGKGNRISALRRVFSDLFNCYEEIIKHYDDDFEHNWSSIKPELIKIYKYPDSEPS